MHLLLTWLTSRHDLSNGCDPSKLVEEILAFTRELLTIPSVAQVVVCEILTHIPVQSGRSPAWPDFNHAHQSVENQVWALISGSENITFYNHINLLNRNITQEMVYTWVHLAWPDM